MTKWYRKKPVAVKAVQYTGNNADEISAFVKQGHIVLVDRGLVIPTLEGDHLALPGDYIIEGVQGEYYPCKPDIFEQTYEELITYVEV